MIVFPSYLSKGDTIGLLCPSGYMDFEKTGECIRVLTEIWGFKVKVGKTLGGISNTYFSGSDEERLQDLQKMLNDDTVKAILCARGGYGLGKIIDKINFKKFCKKPKWIVGFSDITILHTHIHSNYKIATIHGPMAAAFAEGGSKPQYLQSLRKVLEGKKTNYTCKPHSYNKPGKVIGELVGGNLTLLINSLGTPSEIKTNNRILFLEDIGEYIYSIDRMLGQLIRAGKLAKIKGLIIGGFTDTKDTTRPFGCDVYAAINNALQGLEMPICFGFPISHGKENVALKIGGKYQLKVNNQGCTLLEAE